MLMPSIFGENLFDELMEFPFNEMEREMRRADRQLYGRNAKREMKTDVHETDAGYEVDMDLPGFKKDQIELSLQDGYLTVTAAKGADREQKDHAGRLIRQERYSGTMQRSFYVGEHVSQADVKAKFEDGVLHLELPKPEAPQLPGKQVIMIEG